MIKIFLSLVALLVCFATDASSIKALSQQYTMLGEGKLRWFGFSIYESQLYTQSGSFSDVQTEKSVMLVIKYLRDIKKDDLIKRTYKEWRRLPHYEEAKFKPWGALLNDIWHDIKENDQLACVINADGSTTFYDQQKNLGTIKDKDFGWNFLSIWLAKTTSEKSLRKKLLGIKKS